MSAAPAQSYRHEGATTQLKRLKVGTCVCLITQRDTIQTAKLVASIDQVSSGRFLFGIGGGWNKEEIEAHGTVFTSRMLKMREQVAAMKELRLHDGEPITGHRQMAAARI